MAKYAWNDLPAGTKNAIAQLVADATGGTTPDTGGGSASGGLVIKQFADGVEDPNGQSQVSDLKAGEVYFWHYMGGTCMYVVMHDIAQNSNPQADTDYIELDGNQLTSAAIASTISGIASELNGLANTGTTPLVIADSNGKRYNLTVGTDGTLSAVAQP